MHILCVTDSLGSGGAQRQLVSLTLGFKEKGHRVSILIYHNENFYVNLTKDANIDIHIINENSYLKRLLKIRKFIRNGNFDSVLSFQDAPNFICEIAGLPFRKWKLVVGERSANPNIQKSLRLRVFRFFHILADFVVANSYANIKIIRKVMPFLRSKKLLVIYNLVDFEKWTPQSDYVPREYGILRLIIISNHQYLKNAKNLILAVNNLPQHYQNQLLIHWYGRNDSHELIDSYNEATGLVQKYDLNEKIKFFKPQSDINKIIGKYDALGLFSLFEGLPNSICEAMASGKPVIATNVSDISLIIENGITGFIAEGFDASSIEASLIKLLDCSNDQLKEMGQTANKKARLLFDQEKIINSYLEILK